MLIDVVCLLLLLWATFKGLRNGFIVGLFSCFYNWPCCSIKTFNSRCRIYWRQHYNWRTLDTLYCFCSRFFDSSAFGKTRSKSNRKHATRCYARVAKQVGRRFTIRAALSICFQHYFILCGTIASYKRRGNE